MKTIVIPDIHNRTAWIDPFLQQYKIEKGYDKVVFLGDYFDMFEDGPAEARRSALWLRGSLQHPDRIHILGNHDMPYMCPNNRSLWCPGWTKAKSVLVNEVMRREDWDRLVPVVEIDNWLLSHAGASPALFEHPVLGMSNQSVIEQCNKALALVKYGDIFQNEFRYGSRMATNGLVGGITWLDWCDEFVPIKGIHQIVGHSTYNRPQLLNNEDSNNWCIDTTSQHIAIIENGELTFSQEHGVIHRVTGRVIAHHKLKQ